MTQSAVSRQIGKLEAFIGSKLFERVPTGVRLTTIGENYSIDVSRLILDIASVTDGVRLWTGASQITIACSRGIADQWFMPRLKKLSRIFRGWSLDCV